MMDLTWMGDKVHEVRRFLTAWDDILENLEDKSAANERSLRDIFYRQVSTFTVLREDVAHYNRAKARGLSDFDYLLHVPPTDD